MGVINLIWTTTSMGVINGEIINKTCLCLIQISNNVKGVEDFQRQQTYNGWCTWKETEILYIEIKNRDIYHFFKRMEIYHTKEEKTCDKIISFVGTPTKINRIE
jgi:hypothetical protein